MKERVIAFCVALLLTVVAAIVMRFYVDSLVADAKRNCGDEWQVCLWEGVEDE